MECSRELQWTSLILTRASAIAVEASKVKCFGHGEYHRWNNCTPWNYLLYDVGTLTQNTYIYIFLFLLLHNRGKELSPQEPQSSNGGRLTDRVTSCHVVPSMHSTTHCRGHTTSSLLTQRDRPPDIPSPFPIYGSLILIILTIPFWKTKPPGCYFPHIWQTSWRELQGELNYWGY